MKNHLDDRQPSRRTFVKKAAASTVASGALLTGCGPEEEPAKPRLERLYDDPFSPVNLPGRDNYRRPPGWGPSVRLHWDAKNVIMLDSFRTDHLGAFGNSNAPTPNSELLARRKRLKEERKMIRARRGGRPGNRCRSTL
jgi:hypothetical protein